MLDTLIKIRELIEQNRVLEKRNEELKNLVEINLRKSPDSSSIQTSDILAKQEIESLVFKFFQQYKVPSAVYDKDGKLLFSIGWKRLCNDQVKHDIATPCSEGLMQFLHNQPPEKYYHYQCPHGFNSLGFLIEIRNKTFGMLVVSQFFVHGQIPALDTFRYLQYDQKYTDDYLLSLLSEIPVFKTSELENIIQQGALLAEMISFIGNKNLEFYKRFNHQLENEQLFVAIKSKLAEQEEIIQSLINKITQHHDYVQENTVDKSTLKKEVKSLTSRLDHTETILNSILTSIPLGITFVKKNTITYANDQIYKITGYTIKELIGRNPGYIIADQHIWKEILSLSSESFIEKEKTSFEVILNKKDKSTCVALAFVSPHDINNPQNGFTLSFLDISETKNIQTQLLEAKEKAEEADKRKNTFLPTPPVPIPEKAFKTLHDSSPSKMLASHDWSGKTILVAEDEELNYEFIKRLLSPTKVNIAWAENGQKAVDYFNNAPDLSLILMDIKMPVLNGIDATKIIKAKNKNIPVIAQTAYVHDENKKAIMAAGCDEFIPKPVNTAFFISVLEKFLGN